MDVPGTPRPGIEFPIRLVGIPRPREASLAQRMRPESQSHTQHVSDQHRTDPELRERTVSSMVSASLLAVLGTLIFAWALRAPDYPWLFFVGALPWIAGVIMFARALWRYTHL